MDTALGDGIVAFGLIGVLIIAQWWAEHHDRGRLPVMQAHPMNPMNPGRTQKRRGF